MLAILHSDDIIVPPLLPVSYRLSGILIGYRTQTCIGDSSHSATQDTAINASVIRFDVGVPYAPICSGKPGRE